MEYVWDETKRQTNLRVHRLDFETIRRFEWRTAIFRPTYSSEYGNRRFMAIGFL